MAPNRSVKNEKVVSGIDIGSMTSKCVLLKGAKIVATNIIPTDANPKEAGITVFKQALKAAGYEREQISYIVGTGYGRISLDLFDATVTELTCHASGARYTRPDIKGLIDIGGQDSKAIKLKETVGVSDFAMNDRCAAGTGRFLEAMAKALKIDMAKVDEGYRKAVSPCAINSTCVVFAESEVISLLAAGYTKTDIAAGIIESIAKRVGSMAKRIGLKDNLVFVGGGAKNTGLKLALEKYMNTSFLPISLDPQIIGALGAALIAMEKSNGTQSNRENR